MLRTHWPILTTARLELRPATTALATADLAGGADFAKLLGAEVPPSWPPEYYDDGAKRATLRAASDGTAGLFTYYIMLLRGDKLPLLIGTGGYKGSLRSQSTEIGYSLVTDAQGQGLGTELVLALARHAFHQPLIEMVCAHTLPELVASRRVLEKNAFVLRGIPLEEGTIRYEISRAEWQARTSGSRRLT